MRTYRQFREYLERRGFTYVHNPIWVMTNISRFKNYLNEKALGYTIDLDKGVYVVYAQRWVKGVGLAFIPLVEVSGLDVRNDFGKVKDRIDTAMALQEIMG